MIEHRNDGRSLSELADAAFAAATEDVLRRARETGTDIIIWRDDRIVHLTPDEFERERKAAIVSRETT